MQIIVSSSSLRLGRIVHGHQSGLYTHFSVSLTKGTVVNSHGEVESGTFQMHRGFHVGDILVPHFIEQEEMMALLT